MLDRSFSVLAVAGLAIGAVTAAAPARAQTQPPTAAAAGPAAAKVAKAPPSKEVLQKYLQALKQGRAADEKGQLPEARKAFEEAVRLLPEGAAAQSELGWLAYRQNDLELAERATRTAIAASSKPSLRAASLYNLGKILGAKNRKPEAIKAFSDAWEIGQSPAALTELRALDPKAAQTAWPKITPLEGPVKLAETGANGLQVAACRAQLAAAMRAQDPYDQRATPAEIEEKSVESLQCQEHWLEKSGGALPNVMVLTSRFALNHYELNTIAVWVKTAQGWLYRVVDASVDNKWQGDTCSLEKLSRVGSVLEIRKKVMRRDETAMAAYYKGGWEHGQGTPATVIESDGVAYYLGFGPSGKPALTSGIQYSTSLSLEPNARAVRTAEKTYPVALRPTGELQVGAPQITRKQLSEKEFTGRDLQTPVGSFPLKFP